VALLPGGTLEGGALKPDAGDTEAEAVPVAFGGAMCCPMRLRLRLWLWLQLWFRLCSAAVAVAVAVAVAGPGAALAKEESLEETALPEGYDDSTLDCRPRQLRR